MGSGRDAKAHAWTAVALNASGLRRVAARLIDSAVQRVIKAAIAGRAIGHSGHSCASELAQPITRGVPDAPVDGTSIIPIDTRPGTRTHTHSPAPVQCSVLPLADRRSAARAMASGDGRDSSGAPSHRLSRGLRDSDATLTHGEHHRHGSGCDQQHNRRKHPVGAARFRSA